MSPIMVIAVIVAVAVMLVAAEPLAGFIHRNPTIVMLALGLPADDRHDADRRRLRAHVPKGYIYAAMAFSAGVEVLNMLGRRARRKRTEPAAAPSVEARAGQAAPAADR